MHCEKAEMLLSQITFDELDGDDRESLEIHLTSCDNCTAIQRDIGATKNILETVLATDELPSLDDDRRQTLLAAFAVLEEPVAEHKKVIPMVPSDQSSVQEKKKLTVLKIVIAHAAVLMIGLFFVALVGQMSQKLLMNSNSYDAITMSENDKTIETTTITSSTEEIEEAYEVDEVTASKSPSTKSENEVDENVFGTKKLEYQKFRTVNRIKQSKNANSKSENKNDLAPLKDGMLSGVGFYTKKTKRDLRKSDSEKELMDREEKPLLVKKMSIAKEKHNYKGLPTADGVSKNDSAGDDRKTKNRIGRNAKPFIIELNESADDSAKPAMTTGVKSVDSRAKEFKGVAENKLKEKGARNKLRENPKNKKALTDLSEARKNRHKRLNRSEPKKSQIQIDNVLIDEYHIPKDISIEIPTEDSKSAKGESKKENTITGDSPEVAKTKKLYKRGKYDKEKRKALRSLRRKRSKKNRRWVKRKGSPSEKLKDAKEGKQDAPALTEADDEGRVKGENTWGPKGKRKDLAQKRLRELAKRVPAGKKNKNNSGEMGNIGGGGGQKFNENLVRRQEKLKMREANKPALLLDVEEASSGNAPSKKAKSLKEISDLKIDFADDSRTAGKDLLDPGYGSSKTEKEKKILRDIAKYKESEGTVEAVRLQKVNSENALKVEVLKRKLDKVKKEVKEKDWIIKQAEKTMGKSLNEILVDAAGVETSPAKAINGKILTNIEKENMAMISVGKQDGVKVGHRFTIYRGGKYIGRVEVIELYPNMSSTRVIKNLTNDKGLKIQKGDSVATLMGVDKSKESTAEDIVIEKADVIVSAAKEADKKEVKKEEIVEEKLESQELPAANKFPVVPVNPFVLTKQDQLATFSIDTDTASFRVCRNFIQSGYLPPIGAVRMEEFVNYFDYNYSGKSNQTFTIHSELMPSPFGDGLVLMKVGIKGKVIGRNGRKPAHLVFVLDASGSMGKADRMPLVKKGIRLLLNELNPTDMISLVTYGAKSNVFLEKMLVSRKADIIKSLDSIQTGGSTNMVEGIKSGYATAARYFKTEYINRVILCSDGVANVGSVNALQILKQVSKYKEQGITFTSVGFGSGNYNDALLEKLSNSGDGSYLYVNTNRDLKDAFVTELSANLAMIGKDVKIQVAFDKSRVYRYRLIGYENRAVADKDFRNDKVDAGEITSGKTVTALFELQLKAPKDKSAEALDFAKIFVRYKNPGEKIANEISLKVKAHHLKEFTPEDNPRLFMGACAAEFAEILRKSPHAREGDLNRLEGLLRRVSKQLPLDNKIKGLIQLVSKSKGLPRAK